MMSRKVDECKPLHNGGGVTQLIGGLTGGVAQGAQLLQNLVGRCRLTLCNPLSKRPELST